MTIRDLEIFAEVCRHLNMTRAAQELYISQSSVSQAIAALEEEYQTKLFDRLSKKLYLTPRGETLLFYANQVLGSLEQMSQGMRRAGGRELLRIGACTTIGYYLVHPLIDAYERLRPEVKTTVEIGNSSDLEEKLLASKLDVAIVQGTSHPKELEYIVMQPDELFLICHPEHPLAGKTVEIAELSGESLVGREKGSGTQELLERAFSEVGNAPEITWICGNADAVKQAVKKKRGIAILSEYIIGGDLKRKELSFIKLKDYRFTRKFYIACHKDKYKTEGLLEFVKLCGEIKGGGTDEEA